MRNVILWMIVSYFIGSFPTAYVVARIVKGVDIRSIGSGNAEIGAVAVLVMKLRRKIDFAGSVIGQIECVYGSGYRLMPPKSEESR